MIEQSLTEALALEVHRRHLQEADRRRLVQLAMAAKRDKRRASLGRRWELWQTLGATVAGLTGHYGSAAHQQPSTVTE